MSDKVEQYGSVRSSTSINNPVYTQVHATWPQLGHTLIKVIPALCTSRSNTILSQRNTVVLSHASEHDAVLESVYQKLHSCTLQTQGLISISDGIDTCCMEMHTSKYLIVMQECSSLPRYVPTMWTAD